MLEARIALGQVRAEQRGFWRNPAAAFFGFFFPIMFLLIFGTIFNGEKACIDGTYGARGQCVGGVSTPYNTFFVPAMAAWGVITTCLVNLAILVTVHRDNGVLKRMRGTPLPVAAFVVGLVVSALITAVLLVALTSLVGHVLYGSPWPAHPLPAVVTVLLGGTVFCAIGLALTVIIPNADAAPAIVNVIYLPLLFLSGFFFSFSNTLLDDIAKVFPAFGFKEMMLTAFGAKPSSTGWDVHDLPVLLLWGAAAMLVTLRWFRWGSRRA